MSFVTKESGMLRSAAGDLQSIGSAMAAWNMAVAAPATGVVRAAADEVSAQFAGNVRPYQAIGATAVHELFVQALGSALVRTRPPRPPTRSRPAERQRFL